jgi:hypothetical protein
MLRGGWGDKKLLLLGSISRLAARFHVDADSLVDGSRCSRQTQTIKFTINIEVKSIDCEPLAQGIGVPACPSRSSRSTMSSTKRG